MPVFDLTIRDQFTPPNRRFADTAFGALEGTHRQMGDEFLSARYRNLVPVAEGTLRGSGYAQTDRFGGTIITRMGYGTPYAAVQHENTRFRHPKGGQAKYVFGAPNAPLDQNMDRWKRAMLDAVMGAWPSTA